MIRIAENERRETFSREKPHAPGDDADVGARRVAELRAERFQVFPPLRRDAVRAHDDDGVLPLFRRKPQVQLRAGTVIADLAHALGLQRRHHLTVVDERAVREHGNAPAAQIIAHDVDRAFDAAAKSRAFRSDHLHFAFPENKNSRERARLTRPRPRARLFRSR